MSSLLSQLSGQQDEATQAGQSIGAKTKMINEYKASITPKGVTPTSAPKAPPSKPDPGGAYGTRKGEQRIDTSEMTKKLGSFKKGGKVKKTGVYRLHKGERVLNPKQTRKFEKGGALSALAGKAKPSSFKNGGVVEKTGMAKVHAGETVIPNPSGIMPRDSDTGAIVKGTPNYSNVRKIPTVVTTPRTHSMPFDTSNGKQMWPDISQREQ